MRRWILLVTGSGALAVVTYFAAVQTGWVRLGRVSPNPLLECPEVVDVGEVEIYTLAEGRFSVANRGGQPLVLNNIRTTCACAGLERERNGQLVRVSALKLLPGQSVELAIRQAVSGPAGVSIKTPIYFRTNESGDPERCIHFVVSRVKGGVETFPRTVVIGSVVAGTPVREVVDVSDEFPMPRGIERIVTTNHERVHVKELPLEPGGKLGTGRHVARFEVTVHTEKPGTIDDEVQIYLRERAIPTVVSVRGKVSAPVEVSPRTVRLPRMSDGGPLNKVTCLCCSVEGKRLELRVDSCPPDLTVEVHRVQSRQ